jgi:hypothetical protein
MCLFNSQTVSWLVSCNPITEVSHVVKWKETILEKRMMKSSKKRKDGGRTEEGKWDKLGRN